MIEVADGDFFEPERAGQERLKAEPELFSGQNAIFDRYWIYKLHCLEVGRTERLKSQRIDELVIPAQNGDSTALKAISESTTRLVVFLAQAYDGKSQLDLLDLIQEGNAAVLNSLRTFTPDSRAKFTTYAEKAVRNALDSTTQRNKSQFSTPADINGDIREFYEVERLVSNKVGRPATFDEINEFLGWKWEKMEAILRVISPVTYLSSPSSAKDKRTVEEILSDKFINPEGAEEIVDIVFDLESVMFFLNRREERVISLMYGLGNNVPKTHQEISQILVLEGERKVTPGRIGQLETGAIEKLQIVERCKRPTPNIGQDEIEVEGMKYADRLGLAVKLVAKRFERDPEQILGNSRKVPYPTFRNSLMSLFDGKIGITMLGKLLGGRNHSTVTHGIRTLEKDIMVDPIVALIYSTIKRDCSFLLT